MKLHRLIILVLLAFPGMIFACTESGFEINGLPINNGDGTYTIDVTVQVATLLSATSAFGPTNGFFWSLPPCSIISVSPTSLTSANGTTINSVIAGGTVTYGDPLGASGWVLANDAPQSFNIMVVVDCDPSGLCWEGGGQENNLCGPATPPTAYAYNGCFDCVLPGINGNTEYTICEGESIDLMVDVVGEDNVVWAPTGEMGNTITVSPTTTTTYIVTASNDCGPTMLTITVIVDPLPIISPPQDQTICIGESISVAANPQNTTQVTWTPPGSTGPVLVATPTQTTTYTVNGSNNCGDISYDFTVEVIPFPELSLVQGGQLICEGESIELIVEANNEDLLTWLPGGQMTPSILVSPTSNTTYTAVASNSCGTITIDIPVDVFSPPLVIPQPDETICLGDSITLLIDATNADSYVWNPGATPGETITVSPTSTFTYIGVASNICGTSSDSITVSINSGPELVVLSGDQDFCNGASLTFVIDTTGADSIVWTPGGSNATSITVSPSTTTTYTVTVYNECGEVEENITATLVPALQNNLTLFACEGTTADYNGTSLSIGSTTDFPFTTSDGCDSIVTVTVDPLDIFTTDIDLEACEGNTADYQGTPLAIGTTTDFLFTALNGCDSTVSVTVNGLEVYADDLTLLACVGNDASYQGMSLAIGSVTDFTFLAQNGCDSVITVMVEGIDSFSTSLTLEVCDNTTATYQGVSLAIGSVTPFTFTSSLGCDSIVTVTVDGISEYFTSLDLDACNGTTVDYDGTALAAGSVTDFTFVSNLGCDSTVTVSVSDLPTYSIPLTLEACEGTTASYNGTPLTIGTTTPFSFSTLAGCDSIMVVTVNGLDIFASDLTLETCDGTETMYEGTSLAIGTSTDFTFTAMNGCDSVVTVEVDALPIYSIPLTLDACEGTSAMYNGTSLAIGTTTSFNFSTLAGCDSTIVVTVNGLDVFASDLTLETCDGTEAMYEGSSLAIGSSTDFTYVAVNGCDSVVTVEVTGLPIYSIPLTLEACEGTTADYNGAPLAIGTTTDFNFSTLAGCDSTVTVSVVGLEVFASDLTLETCEGTSASYNGTPLAIGTTTDFTFISGNGCDSVVTVQVDALPVYSIPVALEACEGTTANYNGTPLAIGTTTSFNFSTLAGCDSTIVVTVNGLDVFASDLTLETCDGTEANYEGTDLAIGSSTDFTFTAVNGCDSVVTVEVAALPIYTVPLILEACQGTTADYNGTPLAVGTTTDFNFSTLAGCDSTVIVSVVGLEVFASDLMLETCEGTTADYNGNPLSIGTTTDFTLTAANGCDSVVTVQVDGLPIYNTPLTLETCEGTTANYNGQTLTIGSNTPFTFSTIDGCDSVVMVSVIGLDILTSDLMLEVCDGSDAMYQGTPLAIGTSTDFTFISTSGCDSVVTVQVNGLPNFTTPLTLEACEGSSAIYNGTPLAIGTSTPFSFTAFNGCDSTVLVSVNGLEVFASDVNLETCEGTAAMYQGTPLAIGTSTDFTFAAANGCDSVVTVNVGGLPVYTTPLALEACEGTTAMYNGQALAVGTTTPFSFSTIDGCDSTVLVSVNGLEVFASDLTLETCEGTTAFYNGQPLAVGSVTPFSLLAMNGCDSIVTVMVNGLTVYEEDLIIETCVDTPVFYDGQEIPPGASLAINYTSVAGCDSIVTVFAMDVLPLAETQAEILICDGEEVEIFGQIVSAPGAYSAVFSAANGCDSTHVILLDVLEPITIAPTAEASCQDDPTGLATLSPLGGLPPYSYLWNTGDTDSSIENIASGTYEATVTDLHGCTETQNVVIGEHDIQYNTDLLDITCFGDNDGGIIVEDPDPNWDISIGGNIATNGFFDRLSAGTYNLIIQDEFGCVYEDQIILNQPTELVVDLPRDTIIDLGEEIDVYSVFNWNDLIFDWNTNEYFIDDCDNCDGGRSLPLEEIEYVLTVTNENGCTAMDRVTIGVRKSYDLYIPNGFSPNGDGTNEVFMIFSSDHVEEVTEFKVFSRWGELVYQDFNFQTNDPAHSWDGSFRGEFMNPAVFAYYAKVKFIDGATKLFKGDVTLVR